MERLVIPVILANPESIPRAVWEVVLADDDDGNLLNGTPHLTEIRNAGQQHNLYPFWNNAVANLQGPTYAEIGTEPVTITGTADTSSLSLTFYKYQLSYRKMASSTWIPIGDPVFTPVTNGNLGSWTTSNLTSGIYQLRLIVTSSTGLEFQQVIPVGIEKPAYPITINQAMQISPVISGNRIAWYDYRNGRWDIYLYDLSTKTERRITTSAAILDHNSLIISVDKILWKDYRNGYYDIYLYDLSTNTERRITTVYGLSRSAPSISGNKIVWGERRQFIDYNHIYLYDLSTNTERIISSYSTDRDIYPSIS